LLGKSAREFFREIIAGPDFFARVEHPLYTGRQAALKMNSAQRAQKHHKRLRIGRGRLEDSQNENIRLLRGLDTAVFLRPRTRARLVG
jgi:hypothetical protein